MKKPSDEELLARFLEGDEAAFEELVSRYQKALPRFLARYLPDRGLIEEIFQETFIRVYRKADSFEEGRKFKTWCYTIALNLARTEITRLGRRPRAASIDGAAGDDEGALKDVLVGPEDPPERSLEARETGELVRRAVDELSPKHREVFLLYQYEDMSYEEIAQAVGRPVGTVKSQMHYALKDLKGKLERMGVTG